MPVIVPRWEWRSFGDRFGTAESALAALVPAIVETDEMYLLSDSASDVVKVRHELMDIKHLQVVDGDGLERWTPVMKAAFPLPPDAVDGVAAAIDARGCSLHVEHSR